MDDDGARRINKATVVVAVVADATLSCSVLTALGLAAEPAGFAPTQAEFAWEDSRVATLHRRCVLNLRLPKDFRTVVAALRAPNPQVRLMVCAQATEECKAHSAIPITIPPLSTRPGEIDQIITSSRTRDEICQRYPDAWVVAVSPKRIDETDDADDVTIEFCTAVVVAHHKNRKSLTPFIKTKQHRHEELGTYFTGQLTLAA